MKASTKNDLKNTGVGILSSFIISAAIFGYQNAETLKKIHNSLNNEDKKPQVSKTEKKKDSKRTVVKAEDVRVETKVEKEAKAKAAEKSKAKALETKKIQEEVAVKVKEETKLLSVAETNYNELKKLEAQSLGNYKKAKENYNKISNMLEQAKNHLAKADDNEDAVDRNWFEVITFQDKSPEEISIEGDKKIISKGIKKLSEAQNTAEDRMDTAEEIYEDYREKTAEAKTKVAETKANLKVASQKAIKFIKAKYASAGYAKASADLAESGIKINNKNNQDMQEQAKKTAKTFTP
ncbi:MAG: hypothetical protein OIF36_04010 [Alphaproteobacteria bacterium]|nr:hypothetical protein [Alphaproteobacteria bacterium]